MEIEKKLSDVSKVYSYETQRWDYNMGVLTLGMYTLHMCLIFHSTIKGTSKIVMSTCVIEIMGNFFN